MPTEDLLHEEQALLAASRRALALGEREPLTLAPILKGGSDRHFFQLKGPGGGSWIVMHYGLDRRENALFAGIAAFLRKLGVPVPLVVSHDATRRVLWMEDLGATDLHAASAAGARPAPDLYEAAIGAIAPLHRLGRETARREGLQLMPGFDEALYAWERDYFYGAFLGGAARRPLTAATTEQIEAELAPLAAGLARRADDLVHRDFQSQNIIISGGRPFLIDFQGLRAGVRHYDLASLLYDPYVNFDAAVRERLIRFAWQQDAGNQSEEEFRRDLEHAAIQRLMQALGAYGMLGVNKGRTEFLRHIPRALANLREVLAASGAAPTLAAVLADLPDDAGRLRSE
jgi:aminoglycoside/choline kinase family phosphotransferase